MYMCCRVKFIFESWEKLECRVRQFFLDVYNTSVVSRCVYEMFAKRPRSISIGFSHRVEYGMREVDRSDVISMRLPIVSYCSLLIAFLRCSIPFVRSPYFGIPRALRDEKEKKGNEERSRSHKIMRRIINGFIERRNGIAANFLTIPIINSYNRRSRYCLSLRNICDNNFSRWHIASILFREKIWVPRKSDNSIRRTLFLQSGLLVRVAKSRVSIGERKENKGERRERGCPASSSDNGQRHYPPSIWIFKFRNND